MKKKKGINLIVIVILLVVFVKFAMVFGDYKSKQAEDSFVLRLDVKEDFPNTKEGTAVFNVKILMDKIILDFKKVPKYIVFIESKTIPGLVLRYNVHDSVIEGGLPLMKSEEVVFLDNNMHEIAYTFKRGAEQKLFFDRNEVASESFNPRRIGIIGAVAFELEEYEAITVPIDGSVKISDKSR